MMILIFLHDDYLHDFVIPAPILLVVPENGSGSPSSAAAHRHKLIVIDTTALTTILPVFSSTVDSPPVVGCACGHTAC